MFHVNPKGESGRCRAKSPDACRFYKGENDTRHYETEEEARAGAEKMLSNELGTAPKKQKDANQKPRYSFLKEFQEREEEFNEDFDGVPKRFFSTDLRGMGKIDPNIELDAEFAQSAKARIVAPTMMVMLSRSLSSPADNKVSDEVARARMEEAGFTNITAINDSSATRDWGDVAIYSAQGPDEQTYVIHGGSKKPKTELVGRYSFRRTPYDGMPERTYGFRHMTLRSLAGMNRMANLVGGKGDDEESRMLRTSVRMATMMDTNMNRETRGKTMTVALSKMEDKQFEGNNHINVSKRVKDITRGSSARVFEEKMNIPESHVKAAKESAISKYASRVEIDADVDLDNFSQFSNELDQHAAFLGLPSGGDRKPEISVRKLGRHGSANKTVNGLYFPSIGQAGHISVDVNTSAATAHEIGHYVDAMSRNTSMSKDFVDIARRYSKNLPQELKGDSYASDSREVFSRICEMRAANGLPANSRLVDRDKLAQSPFFEPFRRDPELLKDGLAYIEKVFKEHGAPPAGDHSHDHAH